MYYYTPIYRPPGAFTLPRGKEWTLIERPRNGGFERRVDLPVSAYAWGIIGYAEPLTPEELATFELSPALYIGGLSRV